MPYKDEEKAREAARLRKQRQRMSHPNVTPGNVTPSKVLMSRPNGADYDPTEKLYNNPHYPDGTPRYLGPLSDGQCLDRLTVGRV